MNKHKALAIIFYSICLILSHTMCAHVAFAYRDMVCGIKHAGYSAPANVAFFLAIPYLLGILISFSVAFVSGKKASFTGKGGLA